MSDFAHLFRGRSFGLVLPRDDEDQISRFVAMHSGERESVERRPFPRQVDFWAFSLATALALELQPREGPVRRWGKAFIYTSQGIMDDDLCSLLAVISVARLGHEVPETGEPGHIVELANSLAGAGCPRVLEKLSEGTLRTTPLDRAIALAGALLSEVRSSVAS